MLVVVSRRNELFFGSDIKTISVIEKKLAMVDTIAKPDTRALPGRQEFALAERGTF